ncbi:MAG: carboxypeptidase regulatory-like domain-containing protein [Bacteroidetes bacterium]|nr:carboxypeptidase regulatory-like domain-containing protein [Bacteroidota bacterium]
MTKIYFILFSLIVFVSGCSSVDVNVLEVYKKEFGKNAQSKNDPTKQFNNLDLTPVGKYAGKTTDGGKISGKVASASNYEVAFALISFGKVEKGKETVFSNLKSDSKGNFEIINLEPGTYKIVSMQVGYGLTIIDNIDLNSPNSSKDVELILNKN